MRILRLFYEFPPLGDGGSNVLFDLSSELARLGHEIDVATMGYRPPPKQEQANSVNMYRLPSIRKTKTIFHTSEIAVSSAACRYDQLYRNVTNVQYTE